MSVSVTIIELAALGAPGSPRSIAYAVESSLKRRPVTARGSKSYPMPLNSVGTLINLYCFVLSLPSLNTKRKIKS